MKKDEEITILNEPLIDSDGELNQACIDELEDFILNIPPTYERLKNDDEWSQVKDNWLFTHDITGYFATWAIRQSPNQEIPTNLVKVLENVRDVFKQYENEDGMFEMSLNRINEILHKEILPLLYVIEWNDTPPGQDFIDLHALSHNVCLSIRDERRKNKAFDEKFEKEFKEQFN